MASLFQRENSPFWWIKYRDPKTGKTVRESTKYRCGIGPQTRLAETLRAQKTLDESQAPTIKPGEQWDKWVTAFFDLRYSGRTNERMLTAWRTIKLFLAEHKIDVPRMLTREHCLLQYMAWRKKPNKSKGKYRAGHNTAQLELKVLSLIMDEAVNLKFAPFNPCLKLKIKRLKPTKIKPEIPDNISEQILEKIETEPEPLRTFFHNSFKLARYHGARLSETHLNPMRDVEMSTRKEGKHTVEVAKITFNAKGSKIHTVMLHPNLVPMFKALRAAGKQETYEKPNSPAKEWFKFLNRHGFKKILPNVCFHSLRVTVATKLARANVSKKKAMDYVAHASTTVHDSYVRLQPEDLSECADALA
jgi:integrase